MNQQQATTSTMTTPEALIDKGADVADNVNKSLDSLDSFPACYCCNPLENVIPDLLAVKGQAFDSIVVLSKTTGRVASSDFFLCFDHPVYPFPPHAASLTSLRGSMTGGANHCEALLELVDDELGKIYFTIEHDAAHKKNRLRRSPSCECMEQSSRHRSSRESSSLAQQKQQQLQLAIDTQEDERDQDSLMLLAEMLKPGKNSVRYLFRNKRRVLGIAQAAVFLWSDQDKVVVCDVDGTITKSNVRGIYDSIVTEKYGYCHDRVCGFLSSLQCGLDTEDDQSSNINFLYLSSRPLFIADSTRRFLSSLRQPHEKKHELQRKATEDGKAGDTTIIEEHHHHRLPEGPLIGFGGKLSEVLKMELVTHTVHAFKASQLINQLVTPFCKVALDPEEKHRSLFVAGFGNTFMDVQAYHMAGMSLDQIYVIDKSSRIFCLDAGEESDSPSKRRIWSTLSSKLGSGRNLRKDSLLSKGDSMSSRSVPSSLDDSTNNCHMRTADDSLHAEVNDQRLKKPMSRKSYKKFVGTTFVGYHDDGLHSHVFSSTSSMP
jgi:LNS2 (Lipin/Ned1/Smp2)